MNLTRERRLKLNKIAEHYGKEHQRLKLIEELGELTSALATGTEGDVIGELADVEVMMEQIKDLFGARTKVEGSITLKIERQIRRIAYECTD